MYADDTTISYSSENMEDLVVVVKSALSRLSRWLQGNKLSLNVVKTQAMVIGSKQKLSHMKHSYSVIPRFHLGTENIDLVNQTRYLGLIIDETLKWGSQIKNIETKISRALGILKYAKKYVPLATLKEIYKGKVEPNFNYCCSVWGSCGTTRLHKLLKLQNRAARIVTNSPFDSSAKSLVQDLGWPTIEELIYRETSVMTYKCLNKLGPDYLSSCISKLSDRHTRELLNSATDLLIPHMKFFAFRGAKEWNNLDLRANLAPSIHCFISFLKDSKVNSMG